MGEAKTTGLVADYRADGARRPRRRPAKWAVLAATAVLVGSMLTLVSLASEAAAPARANTVPLVTAGGEANVGGGQACALMPDATVWCWGDNSAGQLGSTKVAMPGISTAPVLVEGLPAAIDVSAGRNFTCAVDATNRVWCWGDNSFGELGTGTAGGSKRVATVVPGIKASAVSAGGGQACALTLAKTVECWGQDTSGQLGDGTTTNSATPVAVKNLTNVTAVAAGGSHTCALDSLGGMFCWGSDVYGELGNGASGKNTNHDTPVAVLNLDAGVDQIAAGTEDTCAILHGGDLKCWGENQDGQLGNGTTALEDAPTQVSGLSSGVDSVSPGQNHTCAIASAPVPTAVCWGIEQRGVLGNGVMTGPNLKEPTTVFGLRSPPAGGPGGPLQLAAGFVHTCVVLTSGEVECWGAGFEGQLGIGNTLDRDIPTPVIGLPTSFFDVSAVSEGGQTGCALTQALDAACWGTYVGDGTGNARDSARTPPKVPTGLAQVSGSYVGACVLTVSSQLWCWGDNKWGDLGNGTSGGIDPYPGKVSLAEPVEAVSTGGQTNCALTPDGIGPGAEAWCWGWNNHGQVGDGTTISPRPTPAPVASLGRVTEIVAGQTHTCAIILAGIVQCWGANEHGQLGDNSTNQSSKPVSVSSLGGVVQLALGASFSCALTNAGSVYCWGWNLTGELGDGSTKDSHVPVAVSGIGGANPAVAIAAGNVSACAVLLGGQVRCWGDNSAGELGDPSAGVQSSIPVPVSGFSSDGQISANPNGVAVCALNTNQQASCWGDNYFDELGDGANGGQRDTPGLVKGL